MDGENNGKPDFLMDDLGVPLFLETSICCKSGKVIRYPTAADQIRNTETSIVVIFWGDGHHGHHAFNFWEWIPSVSMFPNFLIKILFGKTPVPKRCLGMKPRFQMFFIFISNLGEMIQFD